MSIEINIGGIRRLLEIYPNERVAGIVHKLNDQAMSLISGGSPDQPGATMIAMTEGCKEPVETLGGVDLPVGALTIGRAPESNILLDDLQVSRFHATLSVHASGKVTIRDLQSSNGTFVNGRRILESQLEKGDVIRVGQTELVFGQCLLPSV